MRMFWKKKPRRTGSKKVLVRRVNSNPVTFDTSKAEVQGYPEFLEKLTTYNRLSDTQLECVGPVNVGLRQCSLLTCDKNNEHKAVQGTELFYVDKKERSQTRTSYCHGCLEKMLAKEVEETARADKQEVQGQIIDVNQPGQGKAIDPKREGPESLPRVELHIDIQSDPE